MNNMNSSSQCWSFPFFKLNDFILVRFLPLVIDHNLGYSVTVLFTFGFFSSYVSKECVTIWCLGLCSPSDLVYLYITGSN